MTTRVEDATKSAQGVIPLFPLPQAVLFPKALLELHVFEPRYRALVRDALQGDRRLSVVLITDPNRLDVQRHPCIANIAGVGEIVEHAELAGGRYNILLRGCARVRLEEVPFVAPYRRAKSLLLEDTSTSVPEGDVAALVTTARSFASLVHECHQSFAFNLPQGTSVGALADLCAHHLVLDARERQRILETLDVPSRVRRVTEVLAIQRHSLMTPELRAGAN